MKEKGFKTLAIAAIAVAGISLAIAYAAFSQTLNINGTATVKANQWSVHYDTTAGVSTATPTGQATNVSENFSTTTTDFTFKCTLVKPGDSVTYTAKVVNDGQIPATLDSITGPTVTGAGASFVEVSLTGVTQGETLAAGAEKTLTIVVTYKSGITEGPAQDVDATISGALNYVQA